MADIKHPSSLSDLQTLFASTTYVAVDFHADWCGPCKQIAPYYANLAKQHGVEGTLAFAKVNVDAAQDIAAVNGNKMIRGADVKSLGAAAEKLGGLAKKKAGL
jgi:thioredoxin 1